MPVEPRISVVVPTVALNGRARACVERLAPQTYANFDVYVVTDEPETFRVAGLDLRFLRTGPISPNHKRLEAARESSADLVALLDDDAYADPDWLANAARHFTDAGVVAVGGPGITPPEDGHSERISGAIYASPLVSAQHARRYVPRAPCDVDLQPACNLLVRRAEFVDAVLQALWLWPGEDAVLCMRLRDGGKRIVYDPSVLVYHHRRRLFWGHFRQVWSYAVARGHIVKRVPEMTRDAAYLVPLFFVGGNLALAFSAMLPAPVRWTIAALACGYAALVGWEAGRARRRFAVDPFAMALGVYLTHLTYGIGVACGFTGLLGVRSRAVNR